jgi:polyhydroxyalkanoate synthesis regulator phasin
MPPLDDTTQAVTDDMVPQGAVPPVVAPQPPSEPVAAPSPAPAAPAITLGAIRQKYPQYQDLSDEQLAQGLHRKFYSDMPFDVFSGKIGYPPRIPETGGRPMSNSASVRKLPMAQTGSDEPVTTGMDPAAIAAPALTPVVGRALDTARQGITDALHPKAGQPSVAETAGMDPAAIAAPALTEPFGRVLSAGAEAFGDEPLGLSDKSAGALRRAGVFPQPGQGLQPLRQINEALLRPVAALADLFWRGSGAGFAGLQQTLHDTALQLGMPEEMARDIAASPEAFFGSPQLAHIRPVETVRNAVQTLQDRQTLRAQTMLAPEHSPLMPGEVDTSYAAAEAARQPRQAPPPEAPPEPPGSAATPETPPGTPPGGGDATVAQPSPAPAADPAAAAHADLAAIAAGQPPSGTALPTLEAMAARAKPPEVPPEQAPAIAMPGPTPETPRSEAAESAAGPSGGKSDTGPPAGGQASTLPESTPRTWQQIMEQEGVSAGDAIKIRDAEARQAQEAQADPPPSTVSPFLPLPREPERLASFLKRMGGVRDPGGDVRSSIGAARYRPGLINQRGRTLDDAAQLAHEAGYFPELGPGERPSINDLLDRLDDDLKSRPVYSHADDAAVTALEAVRDRNREITLLGDQYGIPTAGITHAQFMDQLNAAQLRQVHGKHGDTADAAMRDAERDARGDIAPLEWSNTDAYGRNQLRSLEELERERESEATADHLPQRAAGDAQRGVLPSDTGEVPQGGGTRGGGAGGAGSPYPQGTGRPDTGTGVGPQGFAEDRRPLGAVDVRDMVPALKIAPPGRRPTVFQGKRGELHEHVISRAADDHPALYDNPKNVKELGFVDETTGRWYSRDDAAKVAGIWEASMLPGGSGFAESGTPIPLYSAVSRAVDALKQAKGTGPQMLAMIQKTPGVKPEEVKWIGLDDWLKSQGHVTKAQIADYVRANSLDVREVHRGTVDPATEQRLADMDAEIRRLEAAGDLRWRELSRERGALIRQSPKETKFGQWRLGNGAGGSNYREVLITLPGKPRAVNIDEASQRLFGKPFEQLTMAERVKAQHELSYNPSEYRSSHWDEPNVLAHLRMDERVAPDGARVLLVDEVQSDWHQSGRRAGYGPGTKEYTVVDGNGDQRGTFATREDAQAWLDHPPDWFTRERARVAEVEGQPGVPSAPFKTTWPQLVMRRAIKYAVDNGFDRIAWTPGDVQAARYDLSKQISSVTLHDGAYEKNWLIATDHSGRRVIDERLPDQSKLVDYVGKDVADKLLAQPFEESKRDGIPTRARSLSGLDLKVPHEGMRAFYDRMLPNEVQKIVGKFGAKVGMSEVGTGKPARDTLKPDEQAARDHGSLWQQLVDERRAAENRSMAAGVYDYTRDAHIQAIDRRMDDLHARMVDETLARAQPTQTVHSVDLVPSLVHAVSTEGLALFQPRRLPIPRPTGTDLFGGERAAPAPRPAPEPTIKGDPRQVDMFGKQDVAVQAQAAADQAGGGRGTLTGKGEQKPADMGLFTPKPPNQPGLFGVEPPKRPGAPPRVSRWLTDHGFVDHLASFPEIRPGQDPHAVAADWVFQKGRETGHEYIAVVDNRTGEVVHAGTANLTSQIPFTAENVAGHTDAFTIHHNHPGGRALSPEDVSMLGNRGIGHVVAHGHGGDTYTASLGAAHKGDTPPPRDLLIAAIAAKQAAQDMVQRLIDAGKITYQQGNDTFHDVANRILQAHGVIDYTSTNKMPAAVEAALREALAKGGVNADHIDRSTVAVRPEERVAGLPARVRGQQVQGPAGGAAGNGRGARLPGTPEGRLLEPQGFAEDATTPLTPPEQRRFAPLRRAMGAATEAARDLGTSIARGFVPMRTGTVRSQAFAADFANKLRGVQYRYGEIDREITRQFKPAEREKMGRAMDAQSVHEQLLRDMPAAQRPAARAAFDATREGLAGLEPIQRATLGMLDRLSGDVWRRMQERGMVQPNARPLPFYFARQIIQYSKETGFSKVRGRGASGRGLDQRGANLTTQGPMHREHLTPEETEAAARAKFGPGALLLRDIRSLPARLAYMERAIAGVDLMDGIEQVGRETGVDMVIRGDLPGLLDPGEYFTLSDHPSFRRWRGNGWQPIHVSNEFEGPLKAVLTLPSPTWYRAAMVAKGGVMNAIMFSPFIHLAVELGRSLPIMPGRIVTLRALRDGNRLRRNLDYMDQATTDGLAPLGHGGGWRTDPVSLADQANVEGRNAFLRALGNMRDTAANAAGAVGGRFAHDVLQHPYQTLLWDQVFNLQVGIYDTMRSRYIAKGFAPDVAGTMAAHIANRYAGALPSEHLSKAANMAANLVLFSRSFTLGNLGVMKDMLNGAPAHVLARIEQMAGPDVAKSAQSQLRRKAISAFTMDIGLFLLANGLLQLGLQTLRQSPEQGLPSAAQQTFQSWLDEAGSAVRGVSDNPLSIFKVLPQQWNEPGKESRVYAGVDSHGRAIYLRLPPGKVGEEFLGWWLHSATMIENKMSPLVRPIIETIFGKDTLGRPIYKPNPQTIGDHFRIAGDVVKHFGEGLGPTSFIQGLYEMYQQHVAGKPTQADPYVSAAKVLGPLTGLAQISSGYPGGPAAGEMHALGESQRYDLQKELPAIRDKIRSGDMAGAEADFQRLRVPVPLAKYYVRQTLHPGIMSKGSLLRLQGAPPETQERVRRDLGTPP